MSAVIRLVLILSSVATLVLVLSRVRKERMRVQDALFWVLFVLASLLLAVFPRIAYWVAGILGVASPVNFIYLVFIFFAYLKLLSLSTKIARLESKNEDMAYVVAALRKRLDEEHATPISSVAESETHE